MSKRTLREIVTEEIVAGNGGVWIGSIHILFDSEDAKGLCDKRDDIRRELERLLDEARHAER